MGGATVTKLDAGEWQARVDLAAAFRLTARFGWHEAVANHSASRWILMAGAF
jgi:hypothetical protein